MKRCRKCNKEKTFDCFGRRKQSRDGYKYWCRECENKRATEYFRSKPGLINKIYNNQKRHSEVRKHPYPDYTLQELRDWCMSQDIFHELYEEYVKNNYSKDLIPSIDRLDDYKPYTFSNIRITTWKENKSKGHSDRLRGVNHKRSKAVLQYDLNGNLLNEFYSVMQAERETGCYHTSISNTCKGRQKHSGGFIWKFKCSDVSCE